MNENVQNKLKLLPNEPGCYLMKDKQGTIIYVGKAKNLNNRVHSYFRGAHDYKTTKLVSNIHDFETIVTKTEKESLILEINLIKKHRPRYNIMFMDDKSYPYLKLTKEAYPVLVVSRDKKHSSKADYFGPYTDVGAARAMAELLNDLYPIRKCKTIPKKVCLYYHLKQCLGPCEFQVDDSVYPEMRKEIVKVLRGDVSDLLKRLEGDMNRASEALRFELASKYRDQINALNHIADRQQVQFKGKQSFDLFHYAIYQGYIGIIGFFVREGRLLEREMNVSPCVDEPLDVLESYIMQYYQNQPIPSKIFVPEGMDIELMASVLESDVLIPVKGEKKKLLDLAGHNAHKIVSDKFDLMKLDQHNTDQAMGQLRELLKLENLYRIELFDNSHISGSFAVAGCVVFDEGRPNKNLYRRYRLHQGNNDVASMQEVVYRRYFRMLQEGSVLPDLILADGGSLQQNAIKDVLKSLNLEIIVCALVKDDRHQTAQLLDEEGEPINILKESPLFSLLAQMQDEVHRYAISYHRLLRSKAQTKSILDEVEGLGEVRKKKLLRHFGSLKGIRESSVEELSKIIPYDVALRVKEALDLEKKEINND